MSDKIKSEYNQYMENIKPSDKFLSQLTSTLEEERSSQRKRRNAPMKEITAAAACLILLCGFGVMYSVFGNDIETGEGSSSVTENVTGYLGAVSSEALSTVPFENISWYSGDLTDESLPKALAQKLGSSLDYLSFAEGNEFVNADRADPEIIGRIIEELSAAEESDEKPTGDTLYYMAVFTDGTVAKFSISADGDIEISGDEKKYKITEN